MQGLTLLMFVLLWPALIALGHDVYLFYINEGMQSAQGLLQGQTPNDKGFLSLFASLGFIWTAYHPESYKFTVESVDKETWAYINLLLKQKAVFVGLAFAGFSYVIILIVKLLSVGGKKYDAPGFKKIGPRGDDLISREKPGAYRYNKK